MSPVRIQLQRTKGWRLPPNTVNVARPGRWGNPFSVELVGRERAISAFRDLCLGMFSGPAFKDLTDEQFNALYASVERFRKGHGGQVDVRYSLAGVNVACWCRLDEACHGDVLLELANRHDA